MTLKKLAAALAAAGLAAGLSLAWPGTARATDIPPVGQWAEIFNPYLHAKGNTLCFDDPSGSTGSMTTGASVRTTSGTTAPPACCSSDAAPATPVSCGTSGSASSAFTSPPAVLTGVDARQR